MSGKRGNALYIDGFAGHDDKGNTLLSCPDRTHGLNLIQQGPMKTRIQTH